MSELTDVDEFLLKYKDMTLHDCIKPPKETNSVEVDLSPTSDSDDSVVLRRNDYSFDNVIGFLEDMLIDEGFHSLQKSFLEKYWKEFENSEENKLSYTTIFNEYTNSIEDFIVSYLQERIQNFDMESFISELIERKDHLEGEIFEVLLTLTDFKAFKELFLDYREMKEGCSLDLAKSLCISSVQF